jgi:hypothetical protein
MMWEDNEFYEENGSATKKEGSHIAKQFKYLERTLTNQYSTQVEIKSRLKSGNACYYSVQNL